MWGSGAWAGGVAWSAGFPLCKGGGGLGFTTMGVCDGVMGYVAVLGIMDWKCSAVHQIAVTLVGSHNLLVTDGIWALD